MHIPQVDLYKREEITNVPKDAELKVFLTFQFIGGIGNIAMLITALFSSRVVRNTTWLNLCVTWIVYFISYTLLAFAHQQQDPQETDYPLCVTQAALIYGAPMVTAYAGLALVGQVLLNMRSILSAKKTGQFSQPSQLPTTLLLVAPWLIWLIVVIVALSSGIKYPETVARAGRDLYCEITTGIPGRVVSILVAVAFILAFLFELYIAIVLYRNWRVLKAFEKPDKLSLSMVIRIGVFVGVSILAFSQTFVFLSRRFLVTNLVIALMPFFSFVIFSTQRDILHVWTFRKD